MKYYLPPMAQMYSDALEIVSKYIASVIPAYIVLFGVMFYILVQIIIMERKFKSLKVYSLTLCSISILLKYRQALGYFTTLKKMAIMMDIYTAVIPIYFILMAYNLLFLFWYGIHKNVFKVSRQRLFMTKTSKIVFIVWSILLYLVASTYGLLTSIFNSVEKKQRFEKWYQPLIKTFVFTHFGLFLVNAVFLSFGFIIYGCLIWKMVGRVESNIKKSSKRILVLSFIFSILLIILTLYYLVPIKFISAGKLNIYQTYLLTYADNFIFLLVATGIVILLQKRPPKSLGNANATGRYRTTLTGGITARTQDLENKKIEMDNIEENACDDCGSTSSGGSSDYTPPDKVDPQQQSKEESNPNNNNNNNDVIGTPEE